MSMNQYLSSTTNVASFQLQWRDWYYLTQVMKRSDLYEDVLYQLQLIQRAANPPTGNTLGNVVDVSLGTIISLYHTIRFVASSRNIGNGAYNRFTSALNALAATYPEITSYMTDAAAHEASVENTQSDDGRKILRGRYNA